MARLARCQFASILRRRSQRQADDVSKHRTVLVPANGGAGTVLRHQGLLQVRGRDLREGRRLVADPEQKGRHVVSLLQAAAVEIVPPSEGNDATLALKAAKLECLEGQAGALGQ